MCGQAEGGAGRSDAGDRWKLVFAVRRSCGAQYRILNDDGPDAAAGNWDAGVDERVAAERSYDYTEHTGVTRRLFNTGLARKVG